jgi:hypothetical protein
MAAIIAANLAHAEKGKEKEKERAREKVVNAVFEKYDTNRSGIMEVEELTNVLTMMNGGGDPPVRDATLFQGGRVVARTINGSGAATCSACSHPHDLC